MAIQLIVNGHSTTVEVSAEMPLLWVIRDFLELRGTKYGCGVSVCGACTVLVDGEPTRSCITPVASVAGKRITTIEGLSPDGGHPLQKAWMEVDVPQCGYCQAGQIMSAAALLEKHHQPTDVQIDEAMDGNLCRCGTYLRIRKAIHLAASLRGNELKPQVQPNKAKSGKK
jgi:aerobic-type carbon monoxide dehydrogenase small subunit (CoxS/CutS family)